MAGTLTATGRTGKQVCNSVLHGQMDLSATALSLRANLAQIAMRRLMEPTTLEGNLLTEVVCQAVRDIGIGGPNDSFVSWHRGELDPFFVAFGVEPECAKNILVGTRLWTRYDVYIRGATKRRSLRVPS